MCNFGFECLCVTTMKDLVTCPIWAFDACVSLQCNEGLSASFQDMKFVYG